jgi:hypothetical protein
VALQMSNEDLKYLLEEAKETIASDVCRKKYGSEGGLCIENEWEPKLDRGRWTIYDKARRRYLRYSSLEEQDIHTAIDTIRKTVVK